MEGLESEKRSRNVKKNIISGFFLKFSGMSISFFLVSMTVSYLTEIEYGIWMTMFSLMNWVNFLDMGVSLGLRNRLAESIGKEQLIEAREYLAAGFASVMVLGIFFYIIFICILNIMDFQAFFNTKNLKEEELFQIVFFTGTFVIMGFILSVVNQIYYAIQKAAIVGLIQLIYSIMMLIFLCCLVMFDYRKLVYFIVAFGIATFLSKAFFLCDFFRKNRLFVPHIKDINLEKINNISKIGIKFFIIQVCCIINFSSGNLIIIQMLGPEYIRTYDLVFKVFNAVTIIHTIVLAPLWSSYTDAYVKGDFSWIENTLKKSNLLMIPFIIMVIVLGLYMREIIKLWTGVEIECSGRLILFMAIYTLVLAWNNNFAFFLNGINRADVQLVCVSFGAFLVVPLAYFLINYMRMESEGVILSVLMSIGLSGIVFPMQVYKILKRKE